MYSHWIKTVQEQVRTSLEQTREEMKKYYDQRATPKPDIEVGELVMLNAKNVRTMQPTKKLSLRLYGHFKVIEKGETGHSDLISYYAGKIIPYSTSRFSNHIKSLIELTENNIHETPKMSKGIWNVTLRQS